MKYAIFTVGLPDLTPEEAVKELKTAGYDGIEWRITDQSPSKSGTPDYWEGNLCTWPLKTFVEDAPRIRDLTRGAGLEMPNLGTYVTSAGIADVETAMKGAVRTGAKQLRVSIPPFDPATSYAAQLDRALGQYRDVAALAKTSGVRALVEIHKGNLAPSCSACAAFVRHFDPAHVGAIHDAGNLVLEGFEHYDIGFGALGPYLAHVHLKNALWERAGLRPDGSVAWRGAQAPMDQGQVDITELIRSLRKGGYDGWLSFEDFSAGCDSREKIRKNIAYVKGLEARA